MSELMHQLQDVIAAFESSFGGNRERRIAEAEFAPVLDAIIDPAMRMCTQSAAQLSDPRFAVIPRALHTYAAYHVLHSDIRSMHTCWLTTRLRCSKLPASAAGSLYVVYNVSGVDAFACLWWCYCTYCVQSRCIHKTRIEPCIQNHVLH